MKPLANPSPDLPSPCDHRFAPIAYAGLQKPSLLVTTETPVSGFGTMRCQTCGKTEVVEVATRGDWERLRDALRPVRDPFTRRSITRLPWSLVVEQALGGER